MKLFFILLTITLMNTTPCLAQVPGSNNPYQLFIDFLKQEKRYHNDMVPYPFPFDDIVRRNSDSDTSVVTSPERIKELIGEGIKGIAHEYNNKYSPKLRLSHRIKYEKIGDTAYKAEALVSIPDSNATLHFAHADIGIPKSFDQIEITLMAVESNVAYLLMEDKSKLYDYSYTRPDYVDNGEEEEEKPYPEIEPYCNYYEGNIPGSFGLMDESETINDGQYHFTQARITGKAYNAKGLLLEYETLAEDFRHYLWYRNMDMPYESMKGDYDALKERFPSPKGNNHYHPIYAIRLQASGRISELDVTIRSRSVQAYRLESVANVPVQTAGDIYPTLEEVMKRTATINNETPETLTQKIRVGLYALYMQTEKVGVVASLPFCYNTTDNSSRIRFKQLTYTYKGDASTPQVCDLSGNEHLQDDYFTPQDWDITHLVLLPFPTQAACTLTGELSYSYPNYEVTRFDIDSLPQGVSYKNDSLYISMKPQSEGNDNKGYRDYYDFNYYYIDTDKVNAYDEQGKWIEYKSDYRDNACVLGLSRPAKTFVIIEQTEIVEGEMPFSLPMRTPWEEKPTP